MIKLRMHKTRIFPLTKLLILSSYSLCFAYIPVSDLNRDDLTGIWRLSSKQSFLPKVVSESSLNNKPKYYPNALKEFTVFPKKKKRSHTEDLLKKNVEKFQDMLIKLQEDGSFIQFGNFGVSDQFYEENDESGEESDQYEVDVSQKYGKNENKPLSSEIGSIFGLSLMKGTWDYIDGKLILATDRPSDVDSLRVHDTVLEGQVVATSEKILTDNPILSQSNYSSTTSSDESPSNQLDKRANICIDDDCVDTHLSVPEGSIKIGKFMYPKKHPSFFEQNIFDPIGAGSFELRQVLGSLNTKTFSQNEDIEKFKREDFYGRRFFLTSRPLQYQPKGKLNWNRSLGKYVEDKPKTDPNKIFDLKVMQMEFFANNTFSTDGGVSGDNSKILRGKWNIIGPDRDQLWMQVLRFGFGRSVSGSTYSEGTFLTQNDDRSYWGTIHEVVHKRWLPKSKSQVNNSTGEIINKDLYITDHSEDAVIEKKLEIRGSVMIGLGLEPEPVGRFTMVEQTIKDEHDLDDNEDEEDENDDDDDTIFDSVFE